MPNSSDPTYDEQTSNDEIPSIEDIIDITEQLKPFETDLKNADVERVKEDLRTNLSPHLEYFDTMGIFPTIHGSLLYNDPVNLDIDLAFISRDHLRDTIGPRAIPGLMPGYVNKPSTGPYNFSLDINYTSVQEVEDILKRKNETKEEPDELDRNMLGLSAFIIGSGLLFPEQTDAFRKIQAQYYDLLAKYPELREEAYEGLQETLHNRLERRKKPNGVNTILE